VGDVVFLILLVAFFAIAVLAVRAAELLLGPGASVEGGGEL
jgi:hypothetical protein